MIADPHASRRQSPYFTAWKPLRIAVRLDRKRRICVIDRAASPANEKERKPVELRYVVAGGNTSLNMKDVGVTVSVPSASSGESNVTCVAFTEVSVQCAMDWPLALPTATQHVQTAH
jgi:hypothetical protein